MAETSKHRSFKFVLSAKRILIGTLIVIFSIIIFVVFRMQHLAVSFAYDQISSSNQAALNFYAQSLDESVAHLDQNFYSLLADNLNISLLEIQTEESEIFNLKMQLGEDLRRLYASNDLLNSVFLYSPSGTGEEFIFYSTKLLAASDAAPFKDYVIRTCETSMKGEKFSSPNWTVHTINDVPYLMRIICMDQTFCGGFIRLDTIQNQIDQIYHGSLGSSVILTMDNQLISGDTRFSELPDDPDSILKYHGEDYIFSYVHPDILELKIGIAVPTKNVSSQMNSDLTGFISISAILILLVLFVYICLFFMYRPFLYLADSMKIVADGNLHFRITKHSSVHETAKIYQTFNVMLDEIEHLKSEVYEKELEKEKVTKQFLKMQLKSHFFLNCFNIIYSLAETKRYELIQKLTICLVKYFRYLSLSNEELVNLKDEIDHIKNYMEIQMMRFPGQILFSCDIEEQLYSCKIPMLMLQTFLENAVKYGIDFSVPSPITLSAVSEEKNGTDGILFTITDFGEGFSEELLSFYKKDDLSVPSSQEHGIGIINVKKRLRLIYGGAENISIENHLPSGAQIKIWIPKGEER